MAETVQEHMTTDPIVLESTQSITDAARRMRDDEVGDVLVKEDGRLCGILTDRDIVVRSIAEGRDPEATTLADVCSEELYTVGPDDTLDDVVATMRDHAVRRVPVVEDGVAVGILSMGDLAVKRDPDSALADISEAPPPKE